MQDLIFANTHSFAKLFIDTMTHGREVSPRGSKIRELLDAQIEVHPEFPFQGYRNRQYNYSYFKQEMRWKLGANRYDDSIKQHAKIWESVQNPDGTFNSNYGQFWFGQQMGLMKAVLELIRDPDSRRASIPMLTDNHLSPETKDTVCTEAVTLHIRDNSLYMSVHMRSSDQIFGLGTDIPTFSVLMMLAWGLLREVYPRLQLGTIKITAASSHIYERHWSMVERILQESQKDYNAVQLPLPAAASEVLSIIADRGQMAMPPRLYGPLYNFIYGD